MFVYGNMKKKKNKKNNFSVFGFTILIKILYIFKLFNFYIEKLRVW